MPWLNASARPSALTSTSSSHARRRSIRSSSPTSPPSRISPIAGPIGLVFAVGLRWKRGLYALGHTGVWLALGLAGIRYKVAGREHLPAGPVVFCSNHESNVDRPVLFRALHPQLHILYKAELHKFPIMGTVFDVGGFVAVERDNREQGAARRSRAARSPSGPATRS